MTALTQRTPGVSGGEACVGMTRIAVWMFEEARRAGVDDQGLLKDCPASASSISKPPGNACKPILSKSKKPSAATSKHDGLALLQ